MRYAWAGLALVGFAAAAHAHFVFVYVPESGGEARVVFGHGAEPDPKTFPTRAEKTTLTARGADGKDTPLTLEKGDGNFFRAKFDGNPVTVFGTTEAGVVQRGDTAPLLAFYYPKVIVGDPFAKGVEVGKLLPLELVPVKDGDKVRFKVLAAGKPAGDIDVTVAPPGKSEDDGKTVKSDKDGLTEGFADRGRYCVAAKQTMEKPGEVGGKKYTAVRHTATLVCDVPTLAK